MYIYIFKLFEGGEGGGFFKDENCACFGLDKLLVIFGFVDDKICDICGKVGCHMKIFLTVCAWLHGHGDNLGCIKIT